jgi:Holliday junction resolvase
VLEKSIEASFVRKIKARGWLSIKLDASRLTNGWPDRLVLLPGGVHVFIELKTPKGKVTPLQAHKHQQLREFGHTVFVSRSADEAIEACLSLIKN